MDKVLLKHSNGSKAGLRQTINLPPGAAIHIGIGKANDISFNRETESMISRLHCRLLRDQHSPDQFYVEDCGSEFGTYINNLLITGKVSLEFGDIITIGKNGPKIGFESGPCPETQLT